MQQWLTEAALNDEGSTLLQPKASFPIEEALVSLRTRPSKREKRESRSMSRTTLYEKNADSDNSPQQKDTCSSSDATPSHSFQEEGVLVDGARRGVEQPARKGSLHESLGNSNLEEVELE